jgi:hypothetical protein
MSPYVGERDGCKDVSKVLFYRARRITSR